MAEYAAVAAAVGASPSSEYDRLVELAANCSPAIFTRIMELDLHKNNVSLTQQLLGPCIKGRGVCWNPLSKTFKAIWRGVKADDTYFEGIKSG